MENINILFEKMKVADEKTEEIKKMKKHKKGNRKNE